MWRLEAKSAAFQTGPLSGVVTLGSPNSGLDQLYWRGIELPDWSLLGILAPLRRWNDALAVEEAYVRGADLIVTYQQVPGPNVQPQLYWRLLEAPEHGAAGLEIVVSLRTSLLECRPESHVRSAPGEQAEFLVSNATTGQLEAPQDLTAGKLLTPAGALGSVLVRPQARSFSYVEIAAPEDCTELAAEQNPLTRGWKWEYRLFREHLEKGVIRRGRIQAWFLPRTGDAQIAAQLQAAFLASPPPLTT